MSEPELTNGLREARRARSLTQEEMAAAAGISRQAYGAIERGDAVPSLPVALRLATALGVSVEGLFRTASAAPAPLRVWSPAPPEGRRVRVATVGGRQVAVPVEGIGGIGPQLASGILEPGGAAGAHTPRVRFLPGGESEPDLVVAGCDPASAIVQGLLRERAGVEMLWIPASSRRALEALGEGLAHVAGFHLRGDADSATRAEVDRRLPFRATVVRFATWETGLMTRPGNPLRISSVRDLGRPDLRLVNREVGSGTRATLDRALERAQVPSDEIPGYADTAAPGHWATAQAVASGAADVGVGIRAAAKAFGLGWVPLEEESYDLVIPDHLLGSRGVTALLDLLKSQGLQAQVEALGGYDVQGMGVPA